MPREEPSRHLVIDEELCVLLEKRMEVMRRKEDISRFIEWVLDLYVRGYLAGTEEYEREIGNLIDSSSIQRVVERRPAMKGIEQELASPKKTPNTLSTPISKGDLLTAGEVAKLLSLAPSTVYAFAHRRILPALKLGRSLRFQPEGIDRYLEENETKSR